MLPSSADLTYFLEIAQARNLTHAATRLGISQPSLTLAMQRLEHSVGCALFIRTRQGMNLTKAGERLVAEARHLVSRWEELRAQAQGDMTEVHGRFSLGCHPSVARFALPLFLPELLAAHPGLEILLRHDLSRAITQKVLSLEVDLGVVVNPVPHDDLVMKSLGRDTVTLWKAKALRNEDVLIVEPSLTQTQGLLAKLKRQGFKFKRVIESTSLEVIAAMVASGAGLGILPSRVAGDALTAVKGAPSVHDEIFLVYRTENRGVGAIQAISKAVQAGFTAG